LKGDKIDKLILTLEAAVNFQNYIIRDPKIRNGVPVIKGTEITLKTVLGHLFLGDSIENMIKTYPGLTGESVTAVIAYAAGIAGLDIPEDSPYKGIHLNAVSSDKLLNNEQVAALLSNAFEKDKK
jgi:uncharacterized protein (DUF433 family)